VTEKESDSSARPAQDGYDDKETLRALLAQARQLANTNLQSAWEHALKAQALTQGIGDPQLDAETTGFMGDLKSASCQFEAALELWARVFKLRQQMCDAEGECDALHKLGDLALETGRAQDALDLFGRARDIQQGSGDLAGVVASLDGIGRAHDQLGDLDSALDAWHSALSLADRVGEQANRGPTLLGLARVALHHQHDLAAGEAYLRDAQTSFERKGDATGAATALGRLSLLALLQDRSEGIKPVLEASKRLAEVRAWRVFVEVLEELAFASPQYAPKVLPQSFLLTLSAFMPASRKLEIARHLVETIGGAAPLAPLIAASALNAAARLDVATPEGADAHHEAASLMQAVALKHGAQPAEVAEGDGIGRWMAPRGLLDLYTYIDKLEQGLRGLVPADAWLFDPAHLARQATSGQLFTETAEARIIELTKSENWDALLPLSEAVLSEDSQNVLASTSRGLALTFLERHEEAIDAYRHAQKLLAAPGASVRGVRIDAIHYNLACELAYMGREAEALVELKAAVGIERTHARDAATESYFDRIRENPAFQAILSAD
jgi:tetratricopeptide (TPR) repeat protein